MKEFKLFIIGLGIALCFSGVLYCNYKAHPNQLIEVEGTLCSKRDSCVFDTISERHEHYTLAEFKTDMEGRSLKILVDEGKYKIGDKVKVEVIFIPDHKLLFDTLNVVSFIAIIILIFIGLNVYSE